MGPDSTNLVSAARHEKNMRGSGARCGTLSNSVILPCNSPPPCPTPTWRFGRPGGWEWIAAGDGHNQLGENFCCKKNWFQLDDGGGQRPGLGKGGVLVRSYSASGELDCRPGHAPGPRGDGVVGVQDVTGPGASEGAGHGHGDLRGAAGGGRLEAEPRPGTCDPSAVGNGRFQGFGGDSKIEGNSGEVPGGLGRPGNPLRLCFLRTCK